MSVILINRRFIGLVLTLHQINLLFDFSVLRLLSHFFISRSDSFKVKLNITL